MVRNSPPFRWSQVAALILAGSLSAQAAPRLLRFRLAQISVFQANGGGNSFSGVASFNPELKLGRGLSLSANAGFSRLRSAADTTFNVAEGGVGAIFDPSDRTALELTYGRQIWIENGGNFPLYSVNALYDLKSSFIDRVFLGYSYFDRTGWSAHELRVGVCF